MKKFFVLNGPARCGKDTVARLIQDISLENNPSSWVLFEKVSSELKTRTHALYGIVDATGKTAPADHFELVKDVPQPEFFGMTPRQIYIEVSERLLKPMHGNDVLGKLLASKLQKMDAQSSDLVLIDAGFREEVEPIVAAFGSDNFIHVKISRNGCSFDGDSRRYFSLEDLSIPTFNLDNPTPKNTVDKNGIRKLEEEIRSTMPQLQLQPRSSVLSL